MPNYAEKPSAVKAVSGYVSDSHSDGCLSMCHVVSFI